MSIDTEYLVKGIREYFVTDKMAELVEKIKTGGFKLSKIAVGLAIVYEAIVAVEKLVQDMNEVGLGGEKKKAVQTFIDDAIDLPFYLEGFDGFIIGMVIDAVVLYYNSKFGHGWIDTVKEYL